MWKALVEFDPDVISQHGSVVGKCGHVKRTPRMGVLIVFLNRQRFRRNRKIIAEPAVPSYSSAVL